MSHSDSRNPFAFLVSTENLRGIALMVFARLIFACSDSFTKLAATGLPSTEVIVLRNCISLVVILLIAWRQDALRSIGAVTNPVVAGRAFLEGFGTIAFVTALAHVTIGQTTVILLTVPLILVALSAVIYREEVGWRRWTAIVIGFIGVVLVADPFAGAPSPYLLLTQVTAVTWAFRDLLTAKIAGRIPSIIVTLSTTITVGLMALPGAVFQEWQQLSHVQMLYLLGSGSLIAVSNYLYIAALRMGAIAVVAPFRYSAALWAMLAGFIVWSDIPSVIMLAGTLLIIGSGVYTFQRELHQAKKLRGALSRTAR